VAPPLYPPGSNPQPGVEVTQVRMVAETVVIEVLRDIEPNNLGDAHVTANFTMHNLGTADERMAVRFPISGEDGWGIYPEISDVVIKVNGKQVQYGRAMYPDIAYPDLNIPWVEFDVTFPIKQDVSIGVEYDLNGSGYYPATAFYYILETGAGWKDTIGSADIILRLPYEASPQNVIMDLEIGWATTTPGGRFKGREVRWHFEDFEPGNDQPVQDMEFALVSPSAWQSVLTAQENVAKNPDNGEAWGMLAKAYKLSFLAVKGYREDAGGQELYKLSVEAYEKCLSLKPNDAQWHAGFAELLAHRAMWDAMDGDKTPEALRALNEIHTALELAPNDPVVQEIGRYMTGLLYSGITENEGNFDFPWLTQTPTARPRWTPEPETLTTDATTPTTPAVSPPAATEVAQAVPTRTEHPEATATPAPERSSPFCGSAAFLPLMAVVWFVWKRR
jgi:tetratricopeptide (TPR) repeat protein